MNFRQTARSWTAALSIGALMITVTTVAAGAASGATRTSTDPVPGLPVYLALGDSIAAGQQSAPRSDDYWETTAAWRANGYVAQLFDSLVEDLDCLPASSSHAIDGCRQLQGVNLARSAVPAMGGQPAKPGVTSATLIAEQLPVAIEMLQSRNQDANPRNDVEVITLTVGGNDIFGPVTTACLSGVTPTCTTAIQTVFATFAGNYSTILAELRDAAGPDASIVTMTYYNPLPYCDLAQVPGAVALGDYVLEAVPVTGLGPVGFNGLITAISGQYDAAVTDTYGTLGTGDFVGGGDCLHPDESGHTKIAQAFADAATS